MLCAHHLRDWPGTLYPGRRRIIAGVLKKNYVGKNVQVLSGIWYYKGSFCVFPHLNQLLICLHVDYLWQFGKPSLAFLCPCGL